MSSVTQACYSSRGGLSLRPDHFGNPSTIFGHDDIDLSWKRTDRAEVLRGDAPRAATAGFAGKQ